jgi:plastocyanin
MRNRYTWTSLIVVGVAALGLSRCGSSAMPTGPTYGTPTPMATPTPVATATPSSGTAQVTISGFAFSPLTVSVGTSVTWMNADSVTHTATADPSSAFQFDTGNINPGATSRAVVFSSAGSFAYHCNIHSTMHGTIVVH